jgi:hypothetical protein
MGRTFAENAQPLCHNSWNIPFHAALLLAVWLTACNNTCFTLTSNPPTGTIGIKASDPSPSCTLAKANGAIRVRMGTQPACSSCAGSGNVQHVFASIRGIEARASMTANDDPADWQQLAPQLAEQPLQVDLVRDTADWSAREPLGEIATVPAGIYRQLRVRFVPNQPMTEDRLPERNACGRVGFNCVVTADGRVQPLQLDRRSPELRIMSGRMEGASLFIPPDSNTDLIIELKLVWAWFSYPEEGTHLLPALTGSAKVNRVDFDELGTPEG